MPAKPPRPKALRSFLNRGRQLQFFSNLLNQQAIVLEKVRQLLPPPMAEHCLHARIADDLLIVHTDSPAWVARLRFFGPQLINQFRRWAPKIRSIRILVMPQGGQKMQRQRRGISASAAEAIEKSAQAIEDTALREALLRIAGHQKR